jgi:hypothetical protein
MVELEPEYVPVPVQEPEPEVLQAEEELDIEMYDSPPAPKTKWQTRN